MAIEHIPHGIGIAGTISVGATAPTSAQYPPLQSITRPAVDTAAAAYYLNRQPQTMRAWACRGGPLTPLRINGRLAWPVNELRRMLGEA